MFRVRVELMARQLSQLEHLHLFFYNQSIFDPHLEKFLSFSKKSPQKLLLFKYSDILNVAIVYYRDT